jgi:hypothetical protein
VAYRPNPALVTAIRRSAPDNDFAAALLATSLVESGGRLDAVGDNGNSGGPYQENSAGRGHGIPMAQRFDPVASTQRAVSEFSRYRNADPGLWAARAQRPADPKGYAVKVNQLLPVARQILGSGAAPAPMDAVGQIRAGVGGGLDRASFKRINAYLRRSEADVMAGRDPGDVMGLIAALKFRGAPVTMPAAPTARPAPYAGPGASSEPYGWANQLGRKFGLTLSSTYRSPADNARVGGSKTSAHMTQGAATDFSGSPAAMRALAEWAIRSGQFREVFFDPVGQWDNGVFKRQGIGGHSDHVHITR